MLKMNEVSALIISEDVVLVSILRRFMLNHCHRVIIETRSSFAEVKSLPFKYEVDLVFIDDSITGTANYEVISHLRYEKVVKAPVYYFSNADTGERALKKGANYLFTKPFNPNELINHILSIIGSNKSNSEFTAGAAHKEQSVSDFRTRISFN